MPTESDSKTSSDSQNTLPGLFAKCATIFSVRGRHGSPEDPNRPVMAVTDSPKKRKRVVSLSPIKRAPLQSEEPKIDMAPEDVNVRDYFAAILKDTAAVNEYTAKHAEWIRKEDEDAWDHEVKSRTKSRLRAEQKRELEQEQKAADIIRLIREWERRVIFGNLPSEALPGPHTLDMGGQYLTNKERIDNDSLLYRISMQVPKGALLHLHFNAELNPERLLERAEKIDSLYIRSIRPLLTQEDLHLTETVFSVQDKDKILEEANIFSKGYPGDATNWRQEPMKWKVWMPWKKFQSAFKEQFPKSYIQDEDTIMSEVPRSCAEPGQVRLNPAELWLKSKMVLSEDEAYAPAQTVNGVWARFNQATRCFKGLLNYESVYKWYIGQAIDRLIEEKVMYAELRPMLLDKFIPSNDGKREINNAAQMKLIIEGYEEKQEELRKQGQLHRFPFGLKVIYCTPRSIPKAMMQEEMKQCIELKLQYPNLICGFDLVGAEDRPNHIGFYKEELVAFQKTCEARKIQIPFLFHAGETLLDTGGSSDPHNSNLYDAVVLNSKRIGHGYSLMKHPHLTEAFKKKGNSPGICIELCPISNELLHLCRNIKEHPFPELLAAGIPCTVNSDNPSLFSNSMSHEFYQVMVGAPTISLYSWKQLAHWSIEYSCLSPTQQAEGHKCLDDDWKVFCDHVVNEYGKLIVDGNVDDEKAKAMIREQSKHPDAPHLK
ncbi:Metallo-dependent hydrolase [Setomelanomma holmii]|uniref:Metallo-dependent hydrolase n=1 Tax=Setomelanomma holmii TaxID=210430 RepID=A0A9P4HBH8_9PLEO|nr:Metallo-dependent hydrolase [Setomelanomma holmii]